MKRNCMRHLSALAGQSFAASLSRYSLMLGILLLLGNGTCAAKPKNFFKSVKKAFTPAAAAQATAPAAAQATAPAAAQVAVVVAPVAQATAAVAQVTAQATAPVAQVTAQATAAVAQVTAQATAAVAQVAQAVVAPVSAPAGATAATAASVEVQDVVALVTGNYDRIPLTFGSVIRLKHKATGKYLIATDEKYVHKNSSKQPAVYGGDDKDAPAAHWIIKGVHNGDRWNYALNTDFNRSSMIGWPVRRDHFLRLENVATGRNLHSHHCPSPITKQSEVTNLGDGGLCDTNDNFIVENNYIAGGWIYLASGYAVKLRHQTTGGTLHSHKELWQTGKQEVTTYAGRDANDWWIPELIKQPTANEKIDAVFKETRSTKISYWSPIFWDTETDDCTNNAGDHRVWAHGGSRHDGGDNKPPHDHMELLLGPWGDARARRGPSFFIIQNADDKFKTGPVSFGDKIKIMAVNGGRGEEDKAGLQTPFRYLWMHPSRWGATHREVIISRPEHGGTQGNDAVFVLEPIIDGQTGAISIMDLVRIKNVGMEVYLWAHKANRWGGSYWEILADKGGEDTWGRTHYGAERRVALEKFRFSLVQDQTVADDAARGDLAEVNGEIKQILGAEASKQKVIALTAEKAQLDQQNAELKTQLEATKAEEARLKSDNAKQLDDLKKVQADALAKAQADADAILAKAKSDDAAAQAAAQAAADKLLADTKSGFESEKKALGDQLASEKAEAKQMLQDAKDALEDAKKQAEEDSKKKVDAVAAAAKAELDKVMLQAADLAHTLSFPIGFVKIPGKAKSIAFGLQDHEGEKIIDNKGTKEKFLSFDDFGVISLADGSLAQFMLGADVANPWQRVDLKDDKGVAIKAGDCGVGLDGTTFVISQDGKSLYGINWPGDTAAAIPDPSLGFKLAHAKDVKREEKATRKQKGKKHKKDTKHGKESAARGRGKNPKDAHSKHTDKQHSKHDEKHKDHPKHGAKDHDKKNKPHDKDHMPKKDETHKDKGAKSKPHDAKDKKPVKGAVTPTATNKKPVEAAKPAVAHHKE